METLCEAIRDQGGLLEPRRLLELGDGIEDP